MQGTIFCRWCSVQFTAHVATRYCSVECRTIAIKVRGTPKKINRKPFNPANRQREDPAVIHERRKEYRKWNRLKGLCKDCPQPAQVGGRCENHRKKQQLRDQIRVAKRCYGPLWEYQMLILTINGEIRKLQYGNIISKQFEAASLGNSQQAKG